MLTWPEIDFEPKGETFIKGLLATGGLSVTYGESGCGKTHLATDRSLHVACGWSWFGRKVIPGGVIYIAAEGGLSMRRRVVAFRQHHGLQPDHDIPFALIPSPVNLLDAQADMPELIDLIKKVAGDMKFPLRLIEVDTLSRVLAGGNENAPDDMGHFVHNMDHIRAETGAHVALIHHAGKTPSQGARGHSLLRAAADTEIEVTKSEVSGQSIAKVTKQRDGFGGDTFTFDLRPIELGIDEDGEPVTSCVVVRVEDAAEPKGGAKVSKRIPAEYLKALDYLSDAMADHSEHVVADGIPAGVKVVHVDLWRERLKQRGLHDGAETGKKWFQRVRNTLIVNNRIVIDGPYVWIVKR